MSKANITAKTMVCMVLFGCVSIELGAQEKIIRPEQPAIMRDVALINDAVEFTHPLLPGNRTTQDGRVSVVVEGGTFQKDTYIFRNFLFFLNLPEALEAPLMPGPAGANILNKQPAFLVPVPEKIPVGIEGLSFNFHHTICDATEEFFRKGERPNPYTCGEAGKHDCYDITLITSTSLTPRAQLWGTPATIEVEHPKTVNAKIINVELGEPVKGATLPLSGNLNEPAITEDGRLLSGRRGPITRLWRNPETGEFRFEGHELVYSLLPEDAKACDVRGWQDFHPVSHAPFDSNMKGKYGIAAFPFRDTEGNPIRDGEDMGGTYPWMDRQGANIFMSGIAGRLSEENKNRFPRRCAQANVDCDAFNQSIDFDRGQMVAGLWTHGKFVLLDSMINSIDWSVGVAPRTHYQVDLYQDEMGEDIAVRVGSGRFIEALRAELLPYPHGYTFNANILDSIQNIFNYHHNLQTVTPRDVVWIMSNGVVSDEVDFDDFLDPNAFIISNMQASITRGPRNILGSNTPYYHDGNQRKLFWGMSGREMYTDKLEDIHVQNAATSLNWQVPAYGWVEQGTARIEPVALGGIKAKGFWLNANNRIIYDIPEQQKPIDENDWYISIFIDARKQSQARVNLISFPDGTNLEFNTEKQQQSLNIYFSENLIQQISLPESESWRHLAFAVSDQGKKVEFLLNGFPFKRFESEQPLFQMQAGKLVIGNPLENKTNPAGFKGWIDDFKVFAYVPNVEVQCNHARGTLLSVSPQSNLFTQASAHPDWAHAKIKQQASTQTSNRFVCFNDYTHDWKAHKAALPEHTVSVREAINFPEGPLMFGKPRPDSSKNSFCLSCHTAEGQGGLGLSALMPMQDITLEHDRRRQPFQPPRRVFGNIPANWIEPGPGTGGPEQAIQTGEGGELIDQWILPR